VPQNHKHDRREGRETGRRGDMARPPLVTSVPSGTDATPRSTPACLETMPTAWTHTSPALLDLYNLYSRVGACWKLLRCNPNQLHIHGNDARSSPQPKAIAAACPCSSTKAIPWHDDTKHVPLPSSSLTAHLQHTPVLRIFATPEISPAWLFYSALTIAGSLRPAI
jgi:hypothetical protein